jgi:hypothetical protein
MNGSFNESLRLALLNHKWPSFKDTIRKVPRRDPVTNQSCIKTGSEEKKRIR